MHQSTTGGKCMSETDTRKYIIEMLDEADLRVLRIIYRVLLGLTIKAVV